jgi:hypothetical protein
LVIFQLCFNAWIGPWVHKSTGTSKNLSLILAYISRTHAINPKIEKRIRYPSPHDPVLKRYPIPAVGINQMNNIRYINIHAQRYLAIIQPLSFSKNLENVNHEPYTKRIAHDVRHRKNNTDSIVDTT